MGRAKVQAHREIRLLGEEGKETTLSSTSPPPFLRVEVDEPPVPTPIVSPIVLKAPSVASIPRLWSLLTASNRQSEADHRLSFLPSFHSSKSINESSSLHLNENSMSTSFNPTTTSNSLLREFTCAPLVQPLGLDASQSTDPSTFSLSTAMSASTIESSSRRSSRRSLRLSRSISTRSKSLRVRSCPLSCPPPRLAAL